MAVIVPAILPASRTDLEEKLARLLGLVEEVQLDIVDGRFIAPASWPYTGDPDAMYALAAKEYQLPFWETFRYEIDVMADDPEHVPGQWISAGAVRITLHAESAQSFPRILNHVAMKYGHDKDFAPGLLSLGVAIGLSTDFSVIEPYLDRLNYVQFMGIARIGRQGEPFAPEVLQKIRAFKRKYPDMPLQIDGGVSLATAPALLAAGANRLIVGSDLWKAPSLADELAKLNAVAEQYGRYR